MPKREPRPTAPAWQRAKTHCPHGHPYDETNTRITSKGHRQCVTCMKERGKARTKTGSYVEGWRDQECPICHAKWFIDASLHIRYRHGLEMRGLVSEARRWASAAHLSELNQFDCDPKEVKARRKRWAASIIREQAKGGSYIQRLTKLWGISRAGADQRISRLQALGLVPPRPGIRTLYMEKATHCGKGHEYTEENSYYAQGRRFCRECGRERSRRYMTRRRSGSST